MAKSAALNPASMPFFPGGQRINEEDGNITLASSTASFRSGSDADHRSLSSISPSEYRSVMSSPSPPADERDVNPMKTRSPSFLSDPSRPSPPTHSFRNGPSSMAETRPLREGNIFQGLDSLPEGLDKKDNRILGIAPANFHPMQQQDRESFVGATPPVPIKQAPSFTNPFTSVSPVSSIDSGSQYNGTDMFSPTFESQLKASPLIRDVLERLLRHENATMQIQRDLGELQRKVNLLIERSMGLNAQADFKDPFTTNSNGTNFPLNGPRGLAMNGQPEFKDPFAPNTNGNGFPSSLNGPRGSIGNIAIAPNQSGPDDITTISQRLNTLTSSVGQLLALQTQQMQPSGPTVHSGLPTTSSQMDLAGPNYMNNQSALGHGLPARSNHRAPNPPMRTWSTGVLDLPMRPSDVSMNRQDGPQRDKRRSVTTLVRRDSSGVLDAASDGQRDSGPVVTKWEQLQLAPELLRSLSKFGVGPPNKIQQRALPFLLRGSDIIAQAPPTQERIAAYVIPAIQIAITNNPRQPLRGPIVLMISTTVDQATQAQRMIRDLGSPIGIRTALGVGAVGGDISQDLRSIQQNMPHILCGTPQKIHALFTASGGLVGSEVRFLVLDEVDQLIARNLHEFVHNIVKLLPAPRSRSGTAGPTASAAPGAPPAATQPTFTSPFDQANTGRRFSAVGTNLISSDNDTTNTNGSVERQTALFSNTVPQDVLNLATSIQLREPVRVLVRRDGNVSQSETLQGARGLRQYYLYLAFTAGGRAEPLPTAPGGGLGIIGSGRGASSAETVQAREWKLDALADLLDDVEVTHAVIHVGGLTALDSVVYKLASRSFEAIPLHGDMAAPTKLAALNKYRSTSSALRPNATKVLVVYDVQIKDIPQVPLIINYDLPKAVEEYAHRVSPAIAPNNYSRPGVIVNFVTATGGDVEMLRSIECFYKIKCPEVPLSLRDIV